MSSDSIFEKALLRSVLVSNICVKFGFISLSAHIGYYLLCFISAQHVLFLLGLCGMNFVVFSVTFQEITYHIQFANK